MPDRHAYIDGPADGSSRWSVTSPPSVEFATFAGPLQVRAVTVDAEPEEVATETHRYLRMYRTRRGTWLYEYDRRTSP